MNQTTCAPGVDGLMDYLEGVLAPDARQAIEAHVAGCPRCVAFIASYQETPRILRDATDLTLPVERQIALRAFLRARRTS